MTISRNLSFLAEGVSSTGVLGATYGGTGQSSITTGDLLYGSASNTISKLAIGSTGTILRVVGGVPTWGTDYTGTVTSVAASVPSFLSISGSPITTSGTLAITYSGTALPIANGGTAQTSFTAGQVLYGSFSQSANLYFDGTNLGVGTSSPSTYGKMAVVGSGTNTISAIVDTTGYALLSTQNSGGTTYFGMDNSSGGSFGLGAYARIIYSSGAYPLAISVNGASRLYIGSSGGVSIGNTTDPGAKNLSVSGFGTFGTTTNTFSSVLNVLGNSQLTARRRGYVFADNVSAGTTGNYTVTVTGFPTQGSGAPADMASFYLVTFLSTGGSHELQGVALYTNIYNGNAQLLATLGSLNLAGGTITFGASGSSPTISITNTSGSTPNYYCQVVYLN